MQFTMQQTDRADVESVDSKAHAREAID